MATGENEGPISLDKSHLSLELIVLWGDVYIDEYARMEFQLLL